MADTLVIRFDGNGANPVSWHPLGKSPSLIAPKGEGTLEQAVEATRGWRTLAVVPSSDILLTQVAIPTRNRQRLLQAIPYTLENELSEDIDQLHFAVDTSSKDDNTPVAISSRKTIEGWLEQLNSHGIHPLGIYPDLLCLPLTPGHWTGYLGQQQGLVLTGKNTGFCADAENFVALLKIALEEASSPPAQLDLMYEPGLSDWDKTQQELDSLECKIAYVENARGLMPLLAENLLEKQTLNLLQGDYKQVDKKALQWRRWMPAASLFTFLLGLSLITSILDYSRYQRENTRLANEIRQVFQQTFPETKRIVDPKVQMEQKLTALRKGGRIDNADFITLLTLSAKVIAKTQGSQLEIISYRDGQLDLKLIIKELQALEAMKKQMESQNLAVEIRSANAFGDQVTSHLRISRSGA